MASRTLKVGAAQLGPNQDETPRSEIVARMCTLMRQAIDERCDVVAFPELGLSTYFPNRIRPREEWEGCFDAEMPNASVQPLFELARSAGIAFHLGYAERDGDRYFNTAILVDDSGQTILKYRKVHLPGLTEPPSDGRVVFLEKRYFSIGDLGYNVAPLKDWQAGINLCHDRRYPETYRALMLKGAELVFTGYNTPLSRLATYHNALVMRAGAYQNAIWVVGIAKAGKENGLELIGESCIISPKGEVVAQASTIADELITARIDTALIDEMRDYWRFEQNRIVSTYGDLVQAPVAPGSGQ